MAAGSSKWSTETFLSVLAAIIVGGALVSTFHHLMDKYGKSLTGHTSATAAGTAETPGTPGAIH